ncbi:hypothetical protein PA598K_05849 [Paenibacillus sp. 598K]|uniref:extracellular solute-binding protein n=1 Tax=Paenibacillus sp. 598K TaxID=1117987 RepID=UPI000FFAFB41|nr:extracellular solute-binding protein [Paenibacillus sp. 598K]GBF77306.1 hypothetical protein PA598K_05849 [Paenibacillus sp. 598K]
MKIKKGWQMLMVSCLLAGVLAGCQSQTENGGSEAAGTTPPTESTATSSAGSSETKAEESLLASKEPLELSIYYHYYNGPFKDDWQVYQKAAEFTNVTLKGVVAQAQSDRSISFNTTMAVRPLPDIVANKVNAINEFALMGAFQPLEELIEQYAPNIRKYLEENPEEKDKWRASDGKIYFIPNVQEQYVNSTWFIRQDWLEMANLEAPQTVDEFYNAIKTIQNMDPNGNGQKDEVGIFARSGMNTVRALLTLFGVKGQSNYYYYVDADDTIKSSFYDPEFKTGMSELAKWYKEGLIDQELFTRTNPRETLLGNNQGIAIWDAPGSTSTFNRRLESQIPGFNLQMLTHPKDVNGNRVDLTRSSFTNTEVWGMSSDNEHPEETMKYFDFWYSEQGKLLNSMGVEGLSYDLVDGKPTFKDSFANNPEKALNEMMDSIGGAQQIGGFVTMDYWKGLLEPNAYDKLQRVMEEVSYADGFPQLPFNDDEVGRNRELYSAIQTYVSEKMTKWVLGAEEVEGSYDQFVKELKSLGLDEMMDIYNTAYARLKAAK